MPQIKVLLKYKCGKTLFCTPNCITFTGVGHMFNVSKYNTGYGAQDFTSMG